MPNQLPRFRAFRFAAVLAGGLCGIVLAARLVCSSVGSIHVGEYVVRFEAGFFQIYRIEFMTIRAAIEPLPREVPVWHVGFWTALLVPWALLAGVLARSMAIELKKRRRRAC